MEAHPPTVEDHMAVEATNESESAAAPQNPAPGPMLTDEDLESPSKKRKVPKRKKKPHVSHLLGDKMFCTGFRRCARPVRALRPPPVRCTPYASQIQRRRCSTSTGRSVSPQSLPPSPPPADLCVVPATDGFGIIRVVGSESGRYHPPLTPERLF